MVCLPFRVQAQTKTLHTEIDGVMWYKCTEYRRGYDAMFQWSWIEMGGKKITPEVTEIDWNKSGYIASHKLFYLQHTESEPECIVGPRNGGLYTLQGERIASDSWAPFTYSFRDNGIIIASDYGMSGVYRDGKVIIPFGSFKYYDIIFVDDCYIACNKRSEYKHLATYDIYSSSGILIAEKINNYKFFGGKLFIIIEGDTYNKNKQKIMQGSIVDTISNTSESFYYKTEVKKNNNTYVGLYDANFQPILHHEYSDISKEGNLFKVSANRFHGLVDLYGHELIPVQYKDISIDTKNGFVKVRTDEQKYGLFDLKGNEILAPEFQDCACLGSNLFKFKMNGYWGVINNMGKVIIPLSRHYTKIEYSKTLKLFTFEKEGGYKGECNANGVQTSCVKTAAAKPQQNNPQQQQTTTQESTTQPKPTSQSLPQPRQPQPVQEWVPCASCNNSGQCHICLGGGNSLQNPNSRCYLCSGTGRCTHCAGQGGHYETRYR